MIECNKALILVIDLQEKLVPAMNRSNDIIDNCIRFLSSAECLNVECVITEQYKKGLGATIKAISDILPEAKIFDKMTFSAYSDNSVKEYIDESGKDSIVICGVESHICVLQTAMELKENGYNVYIVEDCVDSRHKSDKKNAINRARIEGIKITSYEAILFELLKTAENEKFKDISRIIK